MGVPLRTKWGQHIIEEVKNTGGIGKAPVRVHMEYPRPQMVRLKPSGYYQILNGWWNYAIINSRKMPEKWDGSILVPFSPESELSFVNRRLLPDEYLWYEKIFFIEDIRENQRIILHFGAVDQRCQVFLNGKRITAHRGGYLPFSVEVTERIKKGKNILRLIVQDFTDSSYETRGKQKLNSGGMFYTAQSGIWQTVWLEWVPEKYIENMCIKPDYDKDMIDISLVINSILKADNNNVERMLFSVKLYEPLIDQNKNSDGACYFCNASRKVIRELDVDVEGISKDEYRKEYHIRIQVPDKKNWSPETPWIYGIGINTGFDNVASYTAMRILTVEKDEAGYARLCLNHTPYFMNGVLDQGYWPESLMTNPCDEAYIHDILVMKQLGYNMLRKHCKIESSRWYYHCDRFGMLVWQDIVNGGFKYNMTKLCYLPNIFMHVYTKKKDTTKSFYYIAGRHSKGSRNLWKNEAVETVELLYNNPSVVCFVLFNEGWGQFDSKEACNLIRSVDDTRFIDAASGWFDQKTGDMRSVHNYFRSLYVEKGPRPFVISEYGGFAYYEAEHVYGEKIYGYGKYKNKEKYISDYNNIKKDIMGLIKTGLCAAVYTQVSDIEEEVNGLLTYDRKVLKV